MQGLVVLLPTLLFAIFAAVVVWFETYYRSRSRDNTDCQSLGKTLDTNKQ